MDTSFQVSIPHTWGYLLSMALSPKNDHHGARSVYSRLFAGILARPRWYSLRIAELESSQDESAVIEIAPSSNVLERMDWEASGREMEDDDVIRHMASNGITQPMVDSTYPYGLTFIDRGLSTDSIHAEFYSDVDRQRHVLLDTYSVPSPIDAHQGWWYPDAQDLERIRILRHIQEYEAPDPRKQDRRESIGTNLTCTLYDWFHVGEHYVYEWLAERPPPDDIGDALPVSEAPNTPRLSLSIDEDVDMGLRATGDTPIAGPVPAPAGDPTHQDGTAFDTSVNADGPLGTDIDIDVGNHIGSSMLNISEVIPNPIEPSPPAMPDEDMSDSG